MKNHQFFIGIMACIFTMTCFAEPQSIEVEGQGKVVQVAIYDGIQKATNMTISDAEKKHIEDTVMRFVRDAQLHGPRMDTIDQDKIQKFIEELKVHIQECEIVEIASLPQNGYSAKMKVLIEEGLQEDQGQIHTKGTDQDTRKRIQIQVLIDEAMAYIEDKISSQTNATAAHVTAPQKNTVKDLNQPQKNGGGNESQSATVKSNKRTQMLRQLRSTLGNLLTSNLTQTKSFIASFVEGGNLSSSSVSATNHQNGIPSAPLASTSKSNGSNGMYVLKCNIKEYSILKTQVTLPGYKNTMIDRLTGCVSCDYSVLIGSNIKIADSLFFKPEDLDLDYQKNAYIEQSEINRIVAKKLADIIATDIMQKMFPLLLVNIASDKELYLNQGGNTIKEGDIYKVYSLGDELIDPISNRLLGYIETEIGMVRIKEVLPSFCKAEWLSGDFNAITFDTVFRPQKNKKVEKEPKQEPEGELFPRKNAKKPWLQ